MMKRHFKVRRPLLATMTIDPERELITVRPRRSRTTYTLPLGDVAEMIVYRVEKANSGHASELAPAHGATVRRGMLR